MTSISVVASGMVTAVGFDAPSSCAAIRMGIDGYQQTRFMFGGTWLTGCPVPFDEGWTGRDKLVQMAAMAVDECLDQAKALCTRPLPLLVCVAEPQRPGRLSLLDATFHAEVRRRLQRPELTEARSQVAATGRCGPVKVLAEAGHQIARGAPGCIVVGVDGLLCAPTLREYFERGRLKTPHNSDGFVPGEAACAVLVSRSPKGQSRLEICGIGRGTEPATPGSGRPLRADGLVEAIRMALATARRGIEEMDFRITDANGEQQGFKEASLALSRLLRVRRPEFDIWHPAESVGEVGAATVPLALGLVLAAGRKAYSPGPSCLLHVGDDSGQRAAVVLQYHAGSDN